MEESPQDNNKEVPTISVVDIVENEDGSSSLSFEVSDDFIEMIKKEQDLEEISQEALSEYVENLLTKCAEGKDGYDYEKLTDKD
jgi:hypothetical protein